MGLGALFNQLEGEIFQVVLNRFVSPVASNQTLGIENGVFRVGGKLIFGSITNQTLTISSEGNIRRCDTVSLIVGDDLYSAVLENSNA